MAPKGSPRDMDKWRETLRDPNIKFPGESVFQNQGDSG
jgi:hypothetical protein